MAKKIINTEHIKKVLEVNNHKVVDLRPIVAMVMRASGCTYQQIADVMGFSRQNAETIVKGLEKQL